MTQASEKKGLWGSIKGAFVEEVPDAAGPPAGTASAPPPAPQQAALQPPPVFHAPPAVDQAVKQKLEAAVAEQAPPGYVELQETLNTLAESIPDEGARWKAALKLAAKHGHTVEALLGDFDKCIGILEQKDRQFDDETQAQLKKKVGDRQLHIQQTDQRIAQLQQELAQLQEQRDAEARQVAADEAKINAVKAGFDLAYQQVHAQLSERRAKLAAMGKAVST